MSDKVRSAIISAGQEIKKRRANFNECVEIIMCHLEPFELHQHEWTITVADNHMPGIIKACQCGKYLLPNGDVVNEKDYERLRGTGYDQ